MFLHIYVINHANIPALLRIALDSPSATIELITLNGEARVGVITGFLLRGVMLYASQ